ncbi:MAG: DUF4350 domain-containing protein, partial [Chloroflexi bacterium]|nr:DUF4350 domain-containing protein [Chloroflexota bacterium]
MRRLSRDTWMAIGMLLLLGVVTAVAALQELNNANEVPPLASFSTQQDGTHAFALWLEKLGHISTDITESQFTIPQSTDLILMFEPTTDISPAEWEKIDEWVEAGGTLLVAGNDFGTLQAFRHYEFNMRFHNEQFPTVTTEHPNLNTPIISDTSLINGRSYFITDRTDYVPLVATNGRPAILTFAQGDGTVMLSGLRRPFTNIGLQEEASP